MCAAETKTRKKTTVAQTLETGERRRLEPSKRTIEEAREWLGALETGMDNDDDAAAVRQTRLRCLKSMSALSQGAGGICVVAPNHLLQQLGQDSHLKYSDDGAATRCCTRGTSSKSGRTGITVHDDEFFAIAAAVYAHYPADRNVRNVSMDGGICASDRSGTVQACAAVFRGLEPSPFFFERSGAKHTAAVDVAWTLACGVVFVRSETGHVRIINAAGMIGRDAAQSCCIEVQCGTLQYEANSCDLATARRLCERVLEPIRKQPVADASKDCEEMDLLVKMTGGLLAASRMAIDVEGLRGWLEEHHLSEYYQPMLNICLELGATNVSDLLHVVEEYDFETALGFAEFPEAQLRLGLEALKFPASPGLPGTKSAVNPQQVPGLQEWLHTFNLSDFHEGMLQIALEQGADHVDDLALIDCDFDFAGRLDWRLKLRRALGALAAGDGS